MPTMIWMVDANGMCFYVNQHWLAFTGRPLEQEIGAEWLTHVSPDFKEKVLTIFREALAEHHGFRLEFPVRRWNGEYRWLSLDGAPRFAEDGRFIGMIGAGNDISDRHSVEAELLDLSGRLINAQERERSRIARELLDDLSQEMALLLTELEQLALQTAGSSPNISRGCVKAQRRAQEVLSDLHRISYEIHPSKLDQLGLVAASLALCREVSRQHNLRLDCVVKDISEPLPRDISLCLYRVTQEAVRNIVKHSGAERARVEMTGSPTEIHLLISDAGVGFDLGAAGRKEGLGLLSMRQRLRLVGGTISIETQPARGTRITVAVPWLAARSTSGNKSMQQEERA